MNDMKSHIDMKSLIEESQVGSRGYTLSGLAIIAFGLWAAVGPFVGPGETWTTNVNHVLLAVVPAAGAVLGGLMMLSRARRVAFIGGLLALAAGLWFMFAPMTYPLWPSGGLGTGPAPGGSVWLAQVVGFLYVTGAVITLVSTYALGFMASYESFEEEAAESHRAPVASDHAHRRPRAAHQPSRRERPHAQPGRRRVQHDS